MLDIRTLRSSLGPLTADYPTLDELSAVLPVTVEAGAVAVDSADWHVRLEVVAQADVTGNGADDWVVWLADETLAGNYRDYAVFIVEDIGANGRLAARRVGVEYTQSPMGFAFDPASSCDC